MDERKAVKEWLGSLRDNQAIDKGLLREIVRLRRSRKVLLGGW